MDPETQAQQLIARAKNFRVEGLAQQALDTLFRAYEVAKTIEAPGGRKAFVIEAIAGEYGELGERERAMALLAEAILEFERADYTELGPSWAKYIRADTQGGGMELASIMYVRLGAFDKALQVARMIECRGYREGALRWIVYELCQHGDLDKAHEVAQSQSGMKNSGLAEVGVAYAKAGKAEQALRVAGALEGFMKASSLAKIAAAFAEMHQVECAQQMLDRGLEAARCEKEDGWRAKETLTLIPVLCTIGKADTAGDLLAEVTTLAATVEGSEKGELDKQIEECRAKILDCVKSI